jgi:hypothetical protein
VALPLALIPLQLNFGYILLLFFGMLFNSLSSNIMFVAQVQLYLAFPAFSPHLSRCLLESVLPHLHRHFSVLIAVAGRILRQDQ